MRVRNAQRQCAEHHAAEVRIAADNAEAARAAAKQDCDDALAAWFLVVGEGQRFDPTIASTWACALGNRDAALGTAEATSADVGQAWRNARVQWRGAVVRADRVSETLAAARRRVSAHHEEKRLAEQADVTAFVSMKL